MRGATRTGPAPDPNALRRNRKDDAASWKTLPETGLTGDIPSWPKTIEDKATVKELALWTELWRTKPQAHIWKALGMEMAVAIYVRTALHAASVGARASYLSAVKRQEESLLLTPAALQHARYRIGVKVEPAVDPDAPPATVTPMRRTKGSSVLGRLGTAVASGKTSVEDDDADDEPGTSTDDDDD